MITGYDQAIIAFYFLFTLGVGLAFRRLSKNTSDYFRAGGAMPWWITGTSAWIAGFSAWTFVGAAGKAYETGTLVLCAFWPSALALGLVYAYTGVRFRRMRVVTWVEAVRARYGPGTEQFYAWVKVPLGVFFGGVGLNAVGVFMASVFDLPMNTVLIALGSVVTVVALVGGAWAVLASDFVQSFLVVTITLVTAYLALAQPAVGGLGGLLHKLPASHFHWAAAERAPVLLMWIAAQFWFKFSDANSMENATAYLMAKSDRDARRMVLIPLLGSIVGPLIFFVPPLVANVTHPGLAAEFPNLAQPHEAAFVAVAHDVMPVGMIGLLVCAMLGATLTSMDAGLNKNVGVFVRGFYGPVLAPRATDKHLLLVGKLATLGFGAVIVAVAVQVNRLRTIGLFDLSNLLAAVLLMPMALPLVWGLFVRRAPAWSAWTTAVVGLAVSYVGTYRLTPAHVQRLMGWAAPLSAREATDLRLGVVTFGTVLIGSGWYFLTALFARRETRASAAPGAAVIDPMPLEPAVADAGLAVSGGAATQPSAENLGSPAIGRATSNAERARQFFANLDTPIDAAADHVQNMDHVIYRMMGLLCLTFGTFVLSLAAAVPNAPRGRLCFVFCGGCIFAMGAVLYLISRRNHEAAATVVPGPDLAAPLARGRDVRLIFRPEKELMRPASRQRTSSIPSGVIALAAACALGVGAAAAARAAEAGGRAGAEVAPAAAGGAGLLDRLTFGDAAAESAHRLRSDHAADVTDGGLGQRARRLLPLSPPSWEGGRVAFTMKIDPDRQNYFTAKFWGGEASHDRLILFVDGKQIGYHHLGDVDLLDFGNDSGEPPFNGRFYYNTQPLPPSLTRGKREIACEIRSMGSIWGYGGTFEKYQKDLTEPTRGVYAAYTHADGCFVPPADEAQGPAPVDPPVRSGPGPEVLDALKARVNREIDAELKSAKPLNEMQMQFLARAYVTAWTAAHDDPKVVQQVTRGMDALYTAWKANPKLASEDPVTPNPGWFPFGPAGEAVSLLAAPLAAELDKPVSAEGASEGTPRRAAWSQLLRAGRDEHTRHRRMYSNQSMITDLNIAWSDRGVAAIDPANALPKEQVSHYLYQSVGLEPWLGSETGHGPERPMGDDYYVLTQKGLTKELGYVGYYGEVLDWVTSIYDATRPTPDAPGDERIRRQIVKLAKARGVFRYPALDADGDRAMRIETVVGWRDDHRPGNVLYAERPSWDASPLYITAATLDPTLVGYVQQMFGDRQFFASVAEEMKTASLRATAGLLATPDQYARLSAQPPSPARLPMTAGQPDFAWADEQDGVVAVKHGDDVFYASLYWRARSAVNFLARVHDVTPRVERIAVVAEQTEFEPSGQTYTLPDYTDQAFGRGGFRYPGDLHQAAAGTKLPIAKLPPGDKSKPGDEDPAAGRGSFYTLRYGDYLIGMNASDDGKSYALKVPLGTDRATDLISGKTLDLTKPLVVAPQTTVVLWLGVGRS